jgi:hypothetical protein
MTFPPRLIGLARVAGLLGPLFLGVIIALLTYVQYDFMRSLGWDALRAPTFDWPSGLALGPFGWLMTAAFILSGMAMMVFASGLYATLQTGSGKIGAALMIFAGLALAGLAFTTDPTIRSTPATWHGRLHDLSFVLLGLSLMPAMIFLGFAFRQDSHWRGLAPYTWATAALAIPTFVLKGSAFYVFLPAELAWSEILAVRLGNMPGG